MPANCRSCHAEIIWAVTLDGKAMPVDAEPSPDGDRWLLNHPAISAPVVVKAGEHAGPARHKSHFATCPQAAEWSKANADAKG